MDLKKYQMTFSSSHSLLENKRDALRTYVNILKKNLGNETKIVGIIEFGSYAKDEAISGSDIDTRIYVTCPNYYIWQPIISNFNQSQKDVLEQRFNDFKKEYGELPKKEYDWWKFNNSLAEKISAILKINIEFGLADYRYANFELQHLDSSATPEHAMLIQSNILYDPHGLVAQMRENIRNKYFKPLLSFYKERCLDKLPFEIYQYTKGDVNDNFKIKKSGQIQWVKWAVRCLRDAVASRTYIVSKKFIYKKAEVLDFYKYNLPEDYELIFQIYSWKTDEKTRKKMVKDFLKNRERYFKLFNSLMPKLESIVEKVNKIEIR